MLFQGNPLLHVRLPAREKFSRGRCMMEFFAINRNAVNIKFFIKNEERLICFLICFLQKDGQIAVQRHHIRDGDIDCASRVVHAQ